MTLGGKRLVGEVSGAAILKYLNTGKSQSIRSSNYDMHWAQLGLRDKWNPLTVSRLCAWSNTTVHDLASKLSMSHHRMNRVMDSRDFFTGPEAFILTIYAIGEMGFSNTSQLLGGLPPALIPIDNDQP